MATGREPGQVRKEAAAAIISGVRTLVLWIRHHNSRNPYPLSVGECLNQ